MMNCSIVSSRETGFREQNWTAAEIIRKEKEKNLERYRNAESIYMHLGRMEEPAEPPGEWTDSDTKIAPRLNILNGSAPKKTGFQI